LERPQRSNWLNSESPSMKDRRWTGLASWIGETMRMLDLALEAGLVGVQLERVDLRGRNLSGANLTNANLRMADLTDAHLRGITAVHTDFSGANILLWDL